MRPAMACWPARKASAAAPASAPHTIHGRRRPNRLVVRSDRAPATGLATSATAAPRPVTKPSTATLCVEPAIAWTWLGSSTESAPMYPSASPRLASPRRAAHHRPARCVGSAVTLVILVTLLTVGASAIVRSLPPGPASHHLVGEG